MVVTQYDYAEYRCKPGKFFGNRESVFKLMYSGAAYDASLLPRWVAFNMLGSIDLLIFRIQKN